MTNDENILEEQDGAPDFTLKTNGGGEITLSQFKGKPVIVYFYPKDNTPGCTTEALDFTALREEFEKLGATVIGISPDSVKKHDNFATKHNLTILLASDPELDICQKYGVWVEKKMYGKAYMGVDRSTFLIDEKGSIAKVWRKVKVKDHAKEVLAATRQLSS